MRLRTFFAHLPLPRGATLGLALSLSSAAGCTGAITTGDEVEPGSSVTPDRAGGRGGSRTGGSGTGGDRAQGGTGGENASEACVPGSGPAVSPGKWRRLTAVQYRNTVRDLLGLEADTSQFLHDTRTGPFATNVAVPQDADVDRYRESAEALAAKAVTDPAKLTKCDPKTTGEDACAGRFIAEFGQRAFRRPLTTEETTALTKIYQGGKADGFAQGLRLVTEAVLQAPSFLYLAEFGGTPAKGVAKLSGHEVASRLSYLLWNTMPDADLFGAAKDGRLDDPAGIRREAERMLASDRFLDTAASFHSQLFHVARLADEAEVTKGTGYPEFDGALRAAMQDEARKFVHHVFTKQGGTLEAILTTPAVFPTGGLTKLYGLGTPGADGRIEVTNGQRAGMLTLAGALTAEPALSTPYAAVYRGKTVRSDLLCEDIPPPTVMVEFNAPPGADKMSEQQLLRVHQENPTCAPCHRLMDSVGFGFSNYDAIGRFRTTGKDGQPIDASGEIVGMEDGKFDGPKALVGKLAKSPQVRACYARQWFRFALGREVAAGDGCSVKALEDVLVKGAGDVRGAVMALVTSDAFRFRRGN